MPEQEMSAYYSQARTIQKERGKKDRLTEVINVIDKNDPANIKDGELYLQPVANYSEITKVKKPATSKNRSGEYYEMFTTKDGAKPTVIGKNGAQNMLEKNTVKAFDEFFEVATKGVGNTNPFEVSSTTRSIDANLHAYKNNVDALTNSNHLRGTAVDVSTSVSNCKEGDQLYTWCENNPKELKKMGIYVYRHALKEGKDHLHIEYVGSNHSKAGVVITEETDNDSD